MTLRPFRQQPWALLCLTWLPAVTFLGGCGQTLTVPNTHMNPQYTPPTYQLQAEPPAVWSALVAEMAAEGGQKPIVQDNQACIGSWAMTFKRTKLAKLACEVSQPGRRYSGQGLTTAWVEAGADGKGSRLHLSRVYMCDATLELVTYSRGDFERNLVARLRTRLGEKMDAVAGATK